MPTYEFHCRECATTFQVERSADAAAEPVSCPVGHTSAVTRLAVAGHSPISLQSNQETQLGARFLGGPLDGRIQDLAGDPVPGTVVRHIHLHHGPKIETIYELAYTTECGWEYRMCAHSDETDSVMDRSRTPFNGNGP